MKQSVILFMSVLLIALIACSGESNKKKEKGSSGFDANDSLKIRLEYNYNENTDSTSVRVVINEITESRKEDAKGSNCSVSPMVKLDKGSRILFSDSVLKFIDRFGYHKTYKGLIKDAILKYEDGKGGGFSEKVAAPEKIGFPIMHTLNKNFEIGFEYTGTETDKGELQLAFLDEDGHPVYVGISSVNGKLIRCPVNQTYKDGPALLSLVRSVRGPVIREEQIKVIISTSYTAKYQTVNIVSRPEQTDPPKLLDGPNPY